MTRRENPDVHDNIIPTTTPAIAADATAPSAAKQPAPVAKGPDGHSVLKRSFTLLLLLFLACLLAFRGSSSFLKDQDSRMLTSNEFSFFIFIFPGVLLSYPLSLPILHYSHPFCSIGRKDEISLSTSHRPASLSNPPKDLFFDILPFLVSFLLHADPDSLALFSSNRLQSELMSLMMCEEPGISAFPEGDNIFCWKGTIHGSKDTAYEGMVYKLSFAFPADYPMKPPKVKFETACFHPNVDVYGNICLDILQVRGRWKSPMFSSFIIFIFLCNSASISMVVFGSSG
ncbi:hypothetical protein BHM03_00054589 [Ensete ventricosum]|nr:hypothetical protein BHM03_00054589 [Ensete ventricosum]